MAPTARRQDGSIARGEQHVESQNDQGFRIAGQMSAVLTVAEQRFAEGAPTEESIDAANEAIGLAVDVPPHLFLRMSPQTMVSLLQMSQCDGCVLAKVAEALLLQADVLLSEGWLIQADVRRQQAGAVLKFIDPAHAN